jgi:lantibiotic transport system permease protein
VIAVLRSEWLKRRRSLTTPLVIGSAAFVPSIILIARFRRPDALPRILADPQYWTTLSVQAWESMALMILPMTVMLVVSLVTQIEDRNNGWKQVHAAPVRPGIVFLAKLAVILLLVAQMLVLFVAAIYGAGIVPALLTPGVRVPSAFPAGTFLMRAGVFLVDVLPIAALQYLLALRFRSFVAPLAVGLAGWLLSIGTSSWHYSFVLPYSYPTLDYLMVEYHRALPVPAPPSVIAAGCFVVFTGAAYVTFALRKDKG